ncbi:hypothetical protein P4G17_02895 [Klebsiella pneumoniae]
MGRNANDCADPALWPRQCGCTYPVERQSAAGLSAEYDERVRAKVAAARADKRPGMSTAQLRQQLQGRYQELSNDL